MQNRWLILFFSVVSMVAVANLQQLPPAGLARWKVPAIGYQGVFAIAAVFDVVASLIAFFVLRRMRVPEGGRRPSAAQPVPAAVPVGAE